MLKNAAMAGITVFNGSGDHGSTCLDGSPNTISVPADSPNATAVGGTTITFGPGNTYQSEQWWDGSNSTPQTGQGGFGVSTFFSKPAYQSGLNSSPQRSIPDVAVNADPTRGAVICEASAGGCPTGSIYGGTSLAAPIWAAFAANLNQALGHNVGALNQMIYPLANTGAFHGPASMSPASDFAHVGLGSPDMDALLLQLSGQTVGTPDPSASAVELSPFGPVVSPAVVPADGATQMPIVVTLRDANHHLVANKTVKLTASGGASAVIAPPSIKTRFDGIAIFNVTDLVPEKVTFTADDSDDSVTPSATPVVYFVTPPAASGSIIASLDTEPADGTTADTITVTLKDSLGRPTPGKVVSLMQGSGNSSIVSPSPAVTDSSGKIAFSVTNLVTETDTYTAIDVSDDNLPVPGNAQVDFTNGPGNCPAGLLRAAGSGQRVSGQHLRKRVHR